MLVKFCVLSYVPFLEFREPCRVAIIRTDNNWREHLKFYNIFCYTTTVPIDMKFRFAAYKEV